MKKWIMAMFVCLLTGMLTQTASAFEEDRAYDAIDAKSIRQMRNMPRAISEAPGEISVAAYGANGADSADDAQAFVDALQQALVTDGTLTVHVPAGTYYISRGLPIYSNTILALEDGATVVATFLDGSMVFDRHLDAQGDICSGSSCTHGGYTQIQNVVIRGGTWNRNSGAGTGNNGIFSLRHGHNITIQNVICKGATNHFLNLSGVDTAKVDGARFENAVAYRGDSAAFWGAHPRGDTGRYESIEAIHLDFPGAGESSAYPLDGTVSKNITVQNCLFQNVFAGIGNHHNAGKQHPTAISIFNNTFTNITANCVNGYTFDALTVSGNRVNGARKLIYVTGKNAVIKGNTIQNTTTYGIQIGEGAAAEISDNTITAAKSNSIYADSKSEVVIRNNTITNPQENGICLIKCTNATVSGNRIQNGKKAGIYINGTKRCTISENTVTGCAGHGIYAFGSASSPCRATIEKNTTNSTAKSNRDIYLGAYCSGCAVSGNTIGKRGLSVQNVSSCRISGNQFAAHSHKYGSWVKTRAATALAKGQEQSFCQVCMKAKTRSLAKLKPTIKVSMTTVPLKVKQSYTIKVTKLAKGDSVRSWKSSNPRIASVNGKGKITGKKAGKAVITVTLASGLKKKITVKVQKSSVKTTKVTLNYKNYTLKPGKTFTLKAKVQPLTSGQKVTFRSTNRRIVRVSAKGEVQAVKKGKAKIIVKSGKKKAVCTVKVK